MQYRSHYESPLGGITLASDGEALTGLWFDGQKYFGSTLTGEEEEKDLVVFDQTRKWLDLYFGGKKPDFVPKLGLKTTFFREAVWRILLEIPYGQTTTYGAIADRMARQMGRSSMSAQAVGGAVGHNPVSVIIPCHRVLGSERGLTGYAGGIEKKIRLLELEGISGYRA